MNRKSLALLLVVALITALLVPVAAFAEDVKFEVSGTFALELTRYKDEETGERTIGNEVDYQALTEAVTCTLAGMDSGYIQWTSSNKNVVLAYPSSKEEFDDPTALLPTLYPVGGGDATIEGKIFKNEDDVKPTATGKFAVKFTAILESSIDWKKPEGYTLVAGETGINLSYEVDVLPKTSTFCESDLKWSVKDSTIARVTNDGYIEGLKEGSTTVTATAWGNPSVTSKELPIKVEEYKEPKAAKVPYEKVEFSSHDFTLKTTDSMKLDLCDYLTTEPSVTDDSIVFTSSDPAIAYASNEDDWTYGRVIIVSAHDGDTVEITAQSELGDKNDKVTITFKEPDPLEKLHFTKTEFTVTMANDGMDLFDYLTVDDPDNWDWDEYADQVIFTSSNPQTIGIEDGSELDLHEPDTVTITVRSVRNPKKAYTSCKVTLVQEPLTSISFTSDVPTKLKQGNDFNLWCYVDTDPYYYAHSILGDDYRDYIYFVASDPQLVEINNNPLDEDFGTVSAIKGVPAGKTEIKAVYDDGKNVVESKPFTLEIEPIPATEVKFAKEAFTIKVGQPITLTESKYMNVKPYTANGFTWEWTVSDPEILGWGYFDSSRGYDTDEMFNEEGYLNEVYVYGKKAGTAKVTVSIRNADGTEVKGSCDITVTDQELKGIAFKKEAYTVNLSNYHEGKNLYLALTPADAFVDWDDLYAESSDPEVLWVAELDDGVCHVVPIAPGTATVTITSRTNTALEPAKATVTVKPIAVQGVSFPTRYQNLEIPMYDVQAASRYEGQNEFVVYANIKPVDAYYTATWKTSDASVAYVARNVANGSDEGSSVYDSPNVARIVAAGPGACEISVTVTDGTNTFTEKINVTVKMATVADLKLNKKKATVYMYKDGDNTLQLFATDRKTDLEVPVTWKSSSTKIAKVDKYGLVTFKRAGKVTITATTKDGNATTAECKLTVKKLAVTSVKPSKKKLTMSVGDQATLSVKVKPTKAYNPAVSFKSSKPSVVSVDQDGNIVALKEGQSVITIKAKDGSKKSAKVTITVKAGAKDNQGDVLDLTIDGDLMDGLTGIDGLDIGDDVMDIDGDIANVTIE